MGQRLGGWKQAVHAILLGGIAASALAFPAAARAQDGAGAPVEGDAGNAIIVTALKREQTLQDVPVAVSVTTAETIERAQIRDLRDLQTVVPSLSVGQRQSVGNTNFFIRGFGNGANNAGIEPSVGVFVDNVYRSRTVAQITDLPDVQRIEVLRGPQSTLFGKNASAGVISITTQQPSFNPGGAAELTYGNFDQVIAKGYVTGPIDDVSAVSLAAGLNRRDGFFRDLGTGDRANERDRWFVRGQLLYDPGSDISLRLIGDYDAIDENCCAVVHLQDGIATPAVLAVGGQVGDPADPYSGNIYNNFNSTNDIRNYGVSAQLDYDINPDFTLASITAWRQTDAVTYQDADFSSADLIYPLFQDLRVRSFTQEFRVAGRIGDRADVLLGAFYLKEDIAQDSSLIYGSHFRDYADILVRSLSGGALSLPMLEGVFGAADGDPGLYAGRFLMGGQGFIEQYAMKSEAISIFSQVDFELADGLVLTLGGNYTDDRKRFVTNAASSDIFSSIDLDAGQYRDFRHELLYGGALMQGVGNALGLDRPATQAEIGQFAQDNMAAFGQIQAGAQAFAVANRDNPQANPLGQLRALQFLPPFVNLPNAVEDGRTRDDNFSYTVRLAYDVNDVFNIYAGYATGFKASSINLSRDSRPAPGDSAAIEAAGLSRNNLVYGSRFAGPEKARVIEAGVKADWGNASANLAVFDQQIEGFQSNIFTGSGFALRNAGKQSTFGVEFEGQATVLGALQLNLGLTYLDPVYDSFVESAVGDLSGTRPARIPEWTVLLGAQYSQPVRNGMLIPRLSYLYQSREQVIEGLPNFLVLNPDGTIADAGPALAAASQFTREVNDLTASLSYELDGGFSLTVWGRNLLDSRDVGVVFDTPAQPRSISGYPNDPRTYGVTARYRF